MKERPILMSAPMVLALLREQNPKTQTRRVIKLNLSGRIEKGASKDAPPFDRRRKQWHPDDANAVEGCPYGIPGDRLWVRETCLFFIDGRGNNCALYRATGDVTDRWTPSIYMPRWASRITLELTDVRVQRVQEISHKDALAEGVEYDVSKSAGAPLPRFQKLWDSINAKKHPWSSNPWVWALSFRRVEA